MAIVGCAGDTASPGTPAAAAFAVLPHFPSHAAAAVPFDRVRVTLRRTASTALDTTIAFPTGADSLVVRLTAEIFGTSETLTLNLALIDAANDTVFRGGPLPVTLSATGAGPAAPIPLRYVGVGANAKTVRISPKTVSVLFRDSVTLTATAYDTSGQPIPGTPIAWRSLDTLLARVPADTLGKVLVGIVRGAARIEAMLPTNIADTAQVTVQPVAAALGLFSGGGQTGGVGAPLAQPMVVRVKAADSLGVPGVAVNFTVVSGGGVVSKATDTTDASGDASTVWTLGGTLGLQSLKASVAAAPGIAATAIATGIVGSAKKLAFLVQPPAGIVGGALAPPVQVVAQDSFGNTATTFAGSVTVALGANPGGATLTGTLTATAAAGIATFNNLALSAPDTGYTLTASAAGLVSATSARFAVSAVNLNAWINSAGGNWSVATNWSKGAVPVATDSVTIKQPGTYTVTVDVNATVARLDVGAASGTQTLAVPAHTLSTLGGAFATNTVLALSGTGTITGAGTNTVAGAFNWTGGNLGGASGAGGAIRVLAGGTLSIAPVVQDSFQNYTLELAGTGTWTGTDTVNTGNGAVLRIASGGSLTIQGAQTLIWSLGGATPAVNVAGTLTSSTPAGTFAGLLLPVNDSGTVNVTSGLLILAVGGTSTGAFTVANNAFLLLGGGTHTLTASSSVTGLGSVQVFNGTVNTAGTWNMSSNTFVAGGTLNFNAATAFTNNLGLSSGAVGGSGLVTVGFTLVWKGGNFGPGGGTVKLNAGATDTIAPAAAVQLAGYTVELAGNGVWSTSQTIAMGSGAVLRVDAGATQTITADPTIAFTLGGAAPLLDDQGTIVRSTSANTVTVAVPLNLAGTVNQQTGTIGVAGGGTMSGTVTQAAGTVLLFSAGTTTLVNKFAVTGSSALTEIAGGTVGGLTATDTAFFDNLTLAGGTVSLSGGTIKTPFEMLWTGPAAVSGGTLFVPATAGLTMSFTTGAPSLVNAKLVIAGSGGWTATTPLSSGSGDTIRVVAGGNLALSGAGGGFLYNLGGAASVFDNRGTVISAATPGTTFTIGAAYAQQGGTLDVTSGRLTLAGGRTPPFMGTATVNAGDTLELAGGTFQMDGPLAIGGGGTLLVSGGTLVTNGVGLGLTGNLTTSGTGALVMN
ncbi:MAG TPA: hypothetical protein VEH83_06990, partial [Gemmatimonadales bacterium]|nr:hypothetical protein [Gemmatimonadales bacterium]